MNDSWHLVLKIHQYSLHMSIFHLHLISITRNCHLRPIRNIGGKVLLFTLKVQHLLKATVILKHRNYLNSKALAKTTQNGEECVHVSEKCPFLEPSHQSYTLFLALVTDI